MTIEDEIDRLYQLPLEEFTAARDHLAKRAGGEAATIRRLQKPNAAAWVVNQLYWKKTRSLARLMSISSRVRTVHSRRLGGQAVDVGEIDATHRAAVRAAVEEAREILTTAGDAASPPTLQAVSDTLQALTWTELNGRLARPIKTTGFEALAGMATAAPRRAKSAEVVLLKPPARPVVESKQERAARDAEARLRERRAVEEELTETRSQHRRAARTLERATVALTRAEDRRRRLEQELEEAASAVAEERDRLHAAREHTRELETQEAQLSGRLARLDEDEPKKS